MEAGDRYRTVAADMESRSARVSGRELSRGILAWAFVLAAMVVLPLSPEAMSVTGDALQRAGTMASELLSNFNHQTTAPAVRSEIPAAAAAGVAPAGAAPAAPAVGGSAGVGRTQPQPAATARAAGAPATSAPVSGAQPTTVPVNVSAPLATNPAAPTTQPAPITQPAPTARPATAQPTAVATTAPALTAAPTAAPTAPATVPVAFVTVAAPARPATYAVPASALRVATTAELTSALNRSTATDIVIADGTYDNSTYFQNTNGHRLYAARLGGALFRAGISMGGNSGQGNGLIQGLAFDVSSSSKTLQNGIIHVWGTGSGSRIVDVTMNGNKIIGSGIHFANPDGAVVRRVQVRNFISYGVFAATSGGASISTPALLEDLDVSGVSRAVPNSSNGTAEACVWLGNSGTVRRAVLRDCSWMGLWTGGQNTRALHEDLDIDRTSTGVYLEHFTTGSTFQRIRIGSGVTDGFICEWNDPAWGGKPGCVDDVIQDAVVASTRIGVWLDAGTTRTTIRRVKFIGQSNSAIFDPSGIGNSYYDNDYSQIDSTAMPVRKIRNF